MIYECEREPSHIFSSASCLLRILFSFSSFSLFLPLPLHSCLLVSCSKLLVFSCFLEQMLHCLLMKKLNNVSPFL